MYPHLPCCLRLNYYLLISRFQGTVGTETHLLLLKFYLQYDQPSEVNAIDLDTNTVTLCDDKKLFSQKLLPKKAARQLRTSLIALQEKCLIHNKLKHKLEAHNDGAIDFVFKMKHKEMLLEMEIREAFLHFMVSILQGYRQFLLPITSAPTVGATDVDNLFNSQVCLMLISFQFCSFYAYIFHMCSFMDKTTVINITFLTG